MTAPMKPPRPARRSLAAAKGTSFALCLLLAGLVAPVVGVQAGALPAALVQAYRERLGVLQSGADRLADRLPCLRSYEASLQSRSGEREIALGETLRREAPLAAAVDRLRSEQAGFEAEIEAQRPALEEKRQRYARIAETVRRQKARLETCHAALFLTPGLCDLGELIAQSLGLMESLDGEIRIAESTLLNAQRGMDETGERLRARLGRLHKAQAEVAGLRAEIRRLESAIVRIKKTQADINVAMQTRLDLLDDFEAALGLEPLNRAMDRVRAVLSAVERLVGEERRIIAIVDAELPEEVGRACSRR